MLQPGATVRRNRLFRDCSGRGIFPAGVKAPESQETPKSSLKNRPPEGVFSAGPGNSSRRDRNNLLDVCCSTGNAQALSVLSVKPEPRLQGPIH